MQWRSRAHSSWQALHVASSSIQLSSSIPIVLEVEYGEVAADGALGLSKIYETELHCLIMLLWPVISLFESGNGENLGHEYVRFNLKPNWVMKLMLDIKVVNVTAIFFCLLEQLDSGIKLDRSVCKVYSKNKDPDCKRLQLSRQLLFYTGCC